MWREANMLVALEAVAPELTQAASAKACGFQLYVVVTARQLNERLLEKSSAYGVGRN